MARTKSKITQSQQIAKMSKQISALRRRNATLSYQLKMLGRYDEAISAAIAESQKQVSFPESRFSLIATGEPGVLHASCVVQVGSFQFNATKEFHAIDVCHSLSYMHSDTIDAWRNVLNIAVGLLNNAKPTQLVE
jgi:hypothetical protein